MNISNIELTPNNQQVEKAQRSLEQKYTKLLREFNSFRQNSISEYEKVIQQLQKSKIHNQGLLKKLQKKYETLLHEQRLKLSKTKQKLQSQFGKEIQNLREIINNKNNSIERLSEMLEASETEKTLIVEENTQNLINIVKSEENCLESKKYSHTELMKMYQYLLEENNCLKKQLLKVQSTKGGSKSNQKTKRNKNASPILYTDQSQIVLSKYSSDSNYLSSFFVKNQKALSNEKQKWINNDRSVTGLQFENKADELNKTKKDLNLKKSKVNSSYQAKNISLVVEEKAQKKKQPKKQSVPIQNIKKTK